MITRRQALKGFVGGLAVPMGTAWARELSGGMKTPEGLPFRSATGHVAAIQRKEISALELLDLYLQRVERFNPTLNAVVALDVEGARARARAADTALARDE